METPHGIAVRAKDKVFLRGVLVRTLVPNRELCSADPRLTDQTCPKTYGGLPKCARFSKFETPCYSKVE